MTLTIKSANFGCRLGVLNPADVFFHDGDTYMALERENVDGLVNTFNLNKRYVTELSSDERVLPLDATLEVRGAAMVTPNGVSKEELDEARAGRFISAIKMHRTRTGLGLKDSKEALDQACVAHGIIR